MRLNDYQAEARRTRTYAKDWDVIYPALKLASEAGEVAGKVGKRLRDADGLFYDHKVKQALALELGDVLWYVAALADDLGYDLEEIARMNLFKLSDRAARGVLGGDGDYR